MSQDYQLTQKWVFITGASSGIGHYFAQLFWEQGCNLVIAARRVSKLNELSQRLNKSNSQKLVALELDLSDKNSIDAALDSLNEKKIDIDVLINNAGVAESDFFINTPFEDMQNVFQTNLQGPWYLTQGISKQMIESKRSGSIINIASILAAETTQRVSAYASSKAALVHMSKILALELARYDIRINCLAPGYIETPLNSDFFASQAGHEMIKRIPQRNLGQYEDLAGPVLLLASHLSRYMTGSTITIDGGHSCRSL